MSLRSRERSWFAPCAPRPGVAHWLPVPAYVLAILTLSAFSQPPAGLPLGDKALHVLEYLGLSAVFARAVRIHVGAPAWWVPAAAAALFCTGAGAFDELLQSYVVLRSSDFADLAADAAGGLLGGAVYTAIGRGRAVQGASVAATPGLA